MVRTNVRVEVNRDAAGAVEGGTRRYLLDGAQVGFSRAREEAPVGATGYLQGAAMYEPQVRNDGSVVWGNTAEYAQAVEEGTAPHTPPLAPIRRWARRVLGDESAAGAVWQSIREEGTDAQPFISKGAERMVRWFDGHDMSQYIRDRL